MIIDEATVFNCFILPFIRDNVNSFADYLKTAAVFSAAVMIFLLLRDIFAEHDFDLDRFAVSLYDYQRFVADVTALYRSFRIGARGYFFPGGIR